MKLNWTNQFNHMFRGLILMNQDILIIIHLHFKIAFHNQLNLICFLKTIIWKRLPCRQGLRYRFLYLYQFELWTNIWYVKILQFFLSYLFDQTSVGSNILKYAKKFVSYKLRKSSIDVDNKYFHLFLLVDYSGQQIIQNLNWFKNYFLR